MKTVHKTFLPKVSQGLFFRTQISIPVNKIEWSEPLVWLRFMLYCHLQKLASERSAL